MTYACDMDGTLTLGEHNWENYLRAVPDKPTIEKVNKLYDEGNIILIYTARPWVDFLHTVHWLKENGVLYNALIMGKPHADKYIDRDSIRPDELP